MNKHSIKLLSVLAIILFIAVIPIVVLATNEDVSVVSTQEEGKESYLIYMNGYTDKTFKYALSNNANPEIMDLVYINSITDLGENQVAYLDASTYEKLSKSGETIYIWAKDENENLILEGIQLDLTKSLSKEKIDEVENTTKKISVDIVEDKDETKMLKKENEEGVTKTTWTGHIEIKDSSKATYYYERTKTTDSAEHQKLMELVEKINKKYDSMDMYEKVQIDTEFYDLYSKLIENAKWQEVENMRVEQPESTIEGTGTGDKYVVLLKKIEDGVETTDVQFLTASYDYEPNVVKEVVATQETTKLPITYDSIALIVVLAIVVIAIIAVFIKIKKLNKDEESK